MMIQLLLAFVFIQKNIGTDRLLIWPFVLILFLSAVVLYSRAINNNKWTLLFRSIYSSRTVTQLMREENAVENSFYGLLVFIFFLSFALFLFNVQLFIGSTLLFSNPFLLYSLILFVLFGIYITKISLLFLLQFVFQQRKLFDEYIIVLMNINIVAGICLIPFNLLIIYGIVFSKPILYVTGGSLFIGSLILRQIRIYIIGVRNHVKWYNIILYLCTLEIIPIIVIITLIDGVGINLNIR